MHPSMMNGQTVESSAQSWLESVLKLGSYKLFLLLAVKIPAKNAMIREINERLPEVVSIMQNVQAQKRLS